MIARTMWVNEEPPLEDLILGIFTPGNATPPSWNVLIGSHVMEFSSMIAQ